MTLTDNLLLDVPVVGVTPGPDYAEKFNDIATRLDAGSWKSAAGRGIDRTGSGLVTADLIDLFASSARIRLEEGLYIVDDQLPLKTGQLLQLDPGAVLQFADTVTGGAALLLIDDETDIEIWGPGCLDGNKAANPTPTGGLLGVQVTNGAARVKIRGLYARNFPANDALGTNGGDGIYVGTPGGGNQPYDVLVDACTLEDNVRQGASVTGGRRVRICRNVISGVTGTAAGYGVDVEPTAAGRVADVLVEENQIYSCCRGIQVSANVDGLAAVRNNQIHDMTHPSAGYGINAVAPDLVVQGNQIDTTTGDGITTQSGSVDAQITGNKIKRAAGVGIQVGTGAIRPQVNNNTVTGQTGSESAIKVNTPAGGTINGNVIDQAGINIQAILLNGATDMTVTANAVTNTGSTGTGIRVQQSGGGAGGTGNAVNSNRIKGFSVGLLFAASATPNVATGNVLSGNTTPSTDTPGTNTLANNI